MKMLQGGRGQLATVVVVLVLGVGSAADCRAQGHFEGVPGVAPPPGPKKTAVKGLLGQRKLDQGTLGYGPPGVHPGFQGFGLGYYLGYGFGGAALGVGCEGGYPLYGGPGYPHPNPTLQRFPLTRTEPFCFFGGPGYPTPDHPNFYGPTGPLVSDQPVVAPGNDSPDFAYNEGYGAFDGTLPYAEQVFAPFASGEGGSPSDGKSAADESTPPAPPPPPPPPPASPELPPRLGDATPTGVGSVLGFEAEPVVKGNGERGMMVLRILPGQTDEKSGVAPGDLIRSANGYVTERSGNLEWIINHAAPDRVLKLSVRSAKDSAIHTVTAAVR